MVRLTQITAGLVGMVQKSRVKIGGGIFYPSHGSMKYRVYAAKIPLWLVGSWVRQL